MTNFELSNLYHVKIAPKKRKLRNMMKMYMNNNIEPK